MGKKQKKNKKEAAIIEPGFSNDQLGENASEEFGNEKYRNTTARAKNKKG